jgi:hypothetical protein
MLRRLVILCLLVVAVALQLAAQPGTEVELKKPEKYKNRKLAAEKSNEKKFSAPKRFINNTVTHYNYYFNANNRLNEIVLRAKQAYRDDFTTLLPFYNYTLDGTAQSAGEIDSVIYKCTAGILLHNLNNDWIDNLYLLMGKAYYYRKNFDSAAWVFSYMNYAFAPKDGGYDIPIGSNASNTNGVFTIVTKEKRTFWKRLTSKPASRNEALLWMVKTQMAAGASSDAGSLLQLLAKDPNFPKYLKADLAELQAYYFYQNKVYDSAAMQLSKALVNAANKEERSRWEFLIAQMYQRTGYYTEAANFYGEAAKHTIDPVMEVYANLNSVTMGGNSDPKALKERIEKLYRLGKKEKYQPYGDIVYYAVAQLELELNRFDAATAALEKSILVSTNPEQKNASCLLLADLFFDKKQYVPASKWYDSIVVQTLKDSVQINRVLQRQPAVKIIATNIAAIEMQDSLQALAVKGEKDREAIVRKLYRQLRKQQGMKEKEEEDAGGNTSFNPAVTANTKSPSDLFGAGGGATKGEWYFNNENLKSQGFNAFKLQWGKRPNVDNWRRQTEIDKVLAANSMDPSALSDVALPSQEGKVGGSNIGGGITFEGMLANIPTTPAMLNASNGIISKALLSNGLAFQNQLNDYLSAVAAYDELLRRFPKAEEREEALFSTIYAAKKIPNQPKADSALLALQQHFPQGKFTQKLTQSKPVNPADANPKATAQYNQIYNEFIAGNYAVAEQLKRSADSTYGNQFWTPQLLFIEAVYYVSQRRDSSALKVLRDLTSLHQGHILVPKANALIDAVQRRKEIERYLTDLQITRYNDEDTVSYIAQLEPPKVIINQAPIVKKDSVIAVAPTIKVEPVVIKKDTITIAKPAEATYTFNLANPHYAVIWLKKVDGVFANETKNSYTRYNREKFYNQPLAITNNKINDSTTLVLIGPFNDGLAASEYISKIKPVAASRITPWLQGDKYSFIVISTNDLQVLVTKKDVEAYLQGLRKARPEGNW